MNDQLKDILNSTSYIIPEFWLLGLGIFILLFSIVTKDKKPSLNILITVFGFLFHILLLNKQNTEPINQLFLGNISVYPEALFFKYIFTFAALLSALLSLYGKKLFGTGSGEYLSILTFLLLGLGLLSMAANFLMLYLSIEVVSFCSYLLTYFKYNKHSAEGSLKYLLFGAFSTALMLYGISLLFAFTGSLSYDALQQIIDLEIGILACGLIFIGLLFKLAAFPFQVWVPDTYYAAPTPFVAFLSTAPKAGAIFVFYILWNKSGLIHSIENLLHYFVVAIAIITIIFGNLAALKQKGAKRLLAYSSIAHTGFILMPLFNITSGSMESLQFYIVIFLFMNFAAFSWVYFMENEFKSDEISLMKGSAKKQVYPAILMLITMISLTGLPITAGFTAKLLVFSTLWQQVQIGNSLIIILFIVGILNVIIALYYYLKMPYFSFFKTPPVTSSPFILNRLQIVFLTVMVFPLLLFFFKPDWLLSLINELS
ncbi:MAG: NADH-quinone oxidoreductase subunit N [Bacteroidota bacterium]